MQKLTLFSILLSVSILLVISDILAHGYLSDKAPEEIVQEEIVREEEVQEEAPIIEETPVDEPVLEESTATGEVLLQSSTLLPAQLDASDFSLAGFQSPTIKEALFAGTIFAFISFSDQVEAYIYQSNLFSAEVFVGSIYEIRYPSETAAFQGYLALRERAMSATDAGLVNETNSYGASSFYFNHKVKTKTVHLVIRKGASIYAFEYEHVNHDRFKALFALLP